MMTEPPLNTMPSKEKMSQVRGQVVGNGSGSRSWGSSSGHFSSLDPGGCPQGIASLLSEMKTQETSVPFDAGGKQGSYHGKAPQGAGHG